MDLWISAPPRLARAGCLDVLPTHWLRRAGRQVGMPRNSHAILYTRRAKPDVGVNTSSLPLLTIYI